MKYKSHNLDIEEKWEEYLNNNLKFPFEAAILDWDGDIEVLDYVDVVSAKKLKEAKIQQKLF